MGCHNTGPWIGILHDVFENLSFGGNIKCRSCLIQEKDRRLAEKCSCNRKSLCLSLRKTTAAFFYNALNTIGKFFHEIPCTGEFERVPENMVFPCGT